MSPLARIVALPVRAYRLLLSPWVGNGCRFQPTCSVYALEALERHGAAKGGYLMVHRICRCHPGAAMAMTRFRGLTPNLTPASNLPKRGFCNFAAALAYPRQILGAHHA